MITTKADRLIRSLIEAGLSLADFTMLATKVMRIQRDFKLDHDGRRQRDRLREQDKLREQLQFDQQWKEEEERRQKGLAKLRELGYVTGEETYQMAGQSTADRFEPESPNTVERKAMQDQRLLPYSKELNEMKQKQRDCCLSFNIDYDLRLNQQSLERACRRAKRNLYEVINWRLSDTLLRHERENSFPFPSTEVFSNAMSVVTWFMSESSTFSCDILMHHSEWSRLLDNCDINQKTCDTKLKRII